MTSNKSIEREDLLAMDHDSVRYRSFHDPYSDYPSSRDPRFPRSIAIDIGGQDSDESVPIVRVDPVGELIIYYQEDKPLDSGSLLDRYEHYQGLYCFASRHAHKISWPKVIPDVDYARARLSGPIQFLKQLLRTWHLRKGDAIPLLGLEEADLPYVVDLLEGRVAVRGRDVKHRIACLFRIRKTLSSLFRNVEVENDWLREPHETLNGQIPMDLLLEGSMENLLMVKEYVEAAAGR